MNSILNFVYGGSEINGNHFFHKSALYNYVSINKNFSSTFNYQVLTFTKNIFLLECKNSLDDFYRKDKTRKTVLDTVPIEFIDSIKKGHTKILLSSISEATKLSIRLFNNILKELSDSLNFGTSLLKLLRWLLYANVYDFCSESIITSKH